MNGNEKFIQRMMIMIEKISSELGVFESVKEA